VGLTMFTYLCCIRYYTNRLPGLNFDHSSRVGVLYEGDAGSDVCHEAPHVSRNEVCPILGCRSKWSPELSRNYIADAEGSPGPKLFSREAF